MTFRRVIAAFAVIGLGLLWLALRSARRRPSNRTGSRLRGSEAGAASDDMAPHGVAFEQIAPPPEDSRVERLRARVAAGGTLTEEEERFMRSEGIDVDPDHDSLGEERGGKLGRGFWDEDRERDLM